MQQILPRILLRFVGAVDLDRVIDETLAEVGRVAGADRSYLFRYRTDGAHLDNTHEWCRPGVPSQRQALQRVPEDLFPWWMQQLRRNEIVHIRDVGELPPEAQPERELLAAQGITSVLVLPVWVDDELAGFVGMDELGAARSWRSARVELMRVVSEAIGRGIGMERRRVERERRQMQQLVSSRRLSSMALMAGGAVHDLNNMLTVVMSYARLIQETAPGEDPGEDAAEILEASERAAALTSRLLGFGRDEGHPARATDLNDLLRSLRPLVERTLGDRIELSLDLAAEPVHAVVVPSHLEHAVLNLVINARDAMPQGGELTVRTASVGREGAQEVALEVTDSGTGVSESIRDQIFEPLFTTKGVGRGTGLGLALVQEALRQSNGRVEVDSESGRGATFRLVLPRAEPDDPRMDARREPPPRGADQRVLLFEREPTVTVVLRRMLLAHGYRVVLPPEGTWSERPHVPADVPHVPADVELVVAELDVGSAASGSLLAATRGRPTVFLLGQGVTPPTLDTGTYWLRKPFGKDVFLHTVHDALQAHSR